MNAEQRLLISNFYGLGGFAEAPSGELLSIRSLLAGRDIFADWGIGYWREDREISFPVEYYASFVPKDAKVNRVLVINAWECQSSSFARQFLLDILGEFPVPLKRRLGDGEVIGDVTFEVGKWTILFVRSNVIVLVRNGGLSLMAVEEWARELDEIIRVSSGVGA